MRISKLYWLALIVTIMAIIITAISYVDLRDVFSLVSMVVAIISTAVVIVCIILQARKKEEVDDDKHENDSCEK